MRKAALILMFACCAILTLAQNDSLTRAYRDENVQTHSFDSTSWKNLKKDLDYSKDQKEKPKTGKKANHDTYEMPSGSWNLNGPFFQTLFYVAVILLIAFLILRLFGFNIFLKNTKVQKRVYTLDDIEEAVMESELDGFLREALEKKMYRLALRIYYLMVIKELSQKNWINWKKDKTNNEYIYEMGSRPGSDSFRDLTRIFERVWYGDANIQEPGFSELSPRFRTFISELRGK